jgi:glycerol kinase
LRAGVATSAALVDRPLAAFGGAGRVAAIGITNQRETGIATGFWDGPAEIATLRRVERRFEPSADDAVRADGQRAWSRAVERSRGWARDR